jgi:hypothetical protein
MDGGLQIADSRTARFFPGGIADYCLDLASFIAFGEEATRPLDDGCAKAFGAECEVYKSFGLKRVVQVRYVGGAGAHDAVEVELAQFPSADSAYASFTKQIIGEGDPADNELHKFDAGAAGAIGAERAYLWKGFYVARIQHPDGSAARQPEGAVPGGSLSAIGTEIGKRLTGAPRLPDAAARLPTEERVSMGVLYAPKDVLAVAGAGAGAMGFYREGDKRYRVVSITREDDAQAADVLKAFGKVNGAATIEGVGDGAYSATLNGKSGGKVEWIVARSGRWVVGVGDEELVVKAAMPAKEKSKVCLSRDEKTRHLKELTTHTR